MHLSTVASALGRNGLSPRRGPGARPKDTWNCHLPREIEAALVAKGFFCVAAGAVGDVHKLYLAGQLGGSRDWLMLELVLSWQAGSVQATFRCDAHSKLIPLSDEFAAVLSAVMRTKLAPSYD